MTFVRKISYTLCAAGAIAGLLSASSAHVAADSVKLTGCLIKGDNGGGFLLINPPSEPGGAVMDRHTVAPGSVGTTPMFANIFYWLEKDNDLTKHIGHRVEIEGDTKGDVKKGEMKLERKDSWTELEVKSDGHEIKARVPNSSIVAGHDDDKKLDVLVRRLDPEKVRMIDAICR